MLDLKYIKGLTWALILSQLSIQTFGQSQLDLEIANRLSPLPLHCITVEFPNKTSHLADGMDDALLLPHQLHPVFYGCLDWHSSVHGHWMLVKLLKEFPNLDKKQEIMQVLNRSFDLEKMEKEAEYFGKYTASKNFERTYGWAWLLKLDEELATWTNNEQAKKWHSALQPLTSKIVTLWKEYLPKQTYPTRVGTHTNTAFGLCFAHDWATATGDSTFLAEIEAKAKSFYFDESNTPAYLEPDGADFFSPSLQVADLMSRILTESEFVKWIDRFYSARSINRLIEKPVVSDRSDYHIVHLDGLSFSRAWCMRSVAKHLPRSHQWKTLFVNTAETFIVEALAEITSGGYGGEHWLASFAIYALSVE